MCDEVGKGGNGPPTYPPGVWQERRPAEEIWVAKLVLHSRAPALSLKQINLLKMKCLYLTF